MDEAFKFSVCIFYRSGRTLTVNLTFATPTTVDVVRERIIESNGSLFGHYINLAEVEAFIVLVGHKELDAPRARRTVEDGRVEGD